MRVVVPNVHVSEVPGVGTAAPAVNVIGDGVGGCETGASNLVTVDEKRSVLTNFDPLYIFTRVLPR